MIKNIPTHDYNSLHVQLSVGLVFTEDILINHYHCFIEQKFRNDESGHLAAVQSHFFISRLVCWSAKSIQYELLHKFLVALDDEALASRPHPQTDAHFPQTEETLCYLLSLIGSDK